MEKHLSDSIVKFCETHTRSYSSDSPEFLALIHDCILKYDGQEEECIKCWLTVFNDWLGLWGLILKGAESLLTPSKCMMVTYTLLQLIKQSLIVAFNRSNTSFPEHGVRPLSSAQV